MRRLQSIDAVRRALSAALGLAPLACGGTVGIGDPDAASAYSPEGSATSNGADTRPDGGGPLAARCTRPAPLIIGGRDTGYETCDGQLRRRAIVDCPNLLPTPPPSLCDNDAGACLVNSDCAALPYGSCQGSPGTGFGCFCTYPCVRDADCSPGSICVCGDPAGQCETAYCNAGTCPSGFACAEYADHCSRSFGCETNADQCEVNADCNNAQCAVWGTGGTSTGGHVCVSGLTSAASCGTGRPFVVAGTARLAPTAARGDWLAEAVAPETGALSPDARAELARRWTEIGRMEHASIAAFARFALQLLAAGAPPTLIEGAQRAMADETVHARLAFALASAYAGADVGPGPLAIDAALDGVSLGHLAAATFAEGCIGETAAAVEAREVLEHAVDPQVRAVLDTITADETRHAELAWRTIAWALGTGDSEVPAVLEAAIAEADAEACRAGTSAARPGRDALLVHGLMDRRSSQRLRHQVLAEIVLPCANALLASTRSRARTLDSSVCALGQRTT